MQVSVTGPWAGFIREAVASGEFDSPDGVVAEALHLLQHRHRQHDELRMMVEASLAEGGDHSDADLDAVLDKEMEKLLGTGQ